MDIRDKAARILSLRENEIFICKRCNRRFYLVESNTHTPVEKRIIHRLTTRNIPSPMKDVCGECHSTKLFYPGETFLDE